MPPNLQQSLWRNRWIAFTLVVIGFMLSFFHRVAPTAIAGELQQAFDVSGAALGALAATYFYVYAVMQIPTGVLVDTLGPRRIVAFGGLIAGIGSVLFGLAGALGAAALGRTLVGLGVSVMFVAVLKVNAEWFQERQFATATGVAVLAGNLGAVFSVAALAYMVTVFSWRYVFVATGLFSLVLAAATWRWMRDSPRAAGLPSLREIDGLPGDPKYTGRWHAGLLQVVRNRAIWPGFWLMFGAASTFISFVGLWAVPYLMQVHGMTRGVAASHVSMSLLGFALGSLALGYFSDRIGRRRPVLICSLAAQAACWGPLAAGMALPGATGYALFAALGASASGFTLSWACAKEVSPPALSGMATSFVNAGQFLAVGILQPLVGWLLDRGWHGELVEGARRYAPGDYRLALGVLLALTVAGVVAALFLRETNCRNIWSIAREK